MLHSVTLEDAGQGPTTALTHIAIVEKLDGIDADWLEKVSDEQYSG